VCIYDVRAFRCVKTDKLVRLVDQSAACANCGCDEDGTELFGFLRVWHRYIPTFVSTCSDRTRKSKTVIIMSALVTADAPRTSFCYCQSYPKLPTYHDLVTCKLLIFLTLKLHHVFASLVAYFFCFCHFISVLLCAFSFFSSSPWALCFLHSMIV